MKVQILGTAAYERVPALFCGCTTCVYARTHGGKNIRTQAQTLINEDLLVDFGQDNYIHALSHNVDYRKVKYLLLTHAHEDHFLPEELKMTADLYGQNDMTLDVYGGGDCRKKFEDLGELEKVRFHEVKAFETFAVGPYTVTALPARHGTADPFVYLISDGEKTVFYDNDSGISLDETYGYLAEKKCRLDLVVADCTMGTNHKEKYRNHRSFLDNKRHFQQLKSAGNVHEGTKLVITHFSHNGLKDETSNALSHEDVCRIAEDMGALCAYDGIILEL